MAALILAAASAAGIRRLTFDTDVLSLLPRDGRVTPAFRAFVEHFGSLDRLYLVFTAPDGHTIADYEREVDAWLERLRRSPLVTSVDGGVADASRDLSWLADRQLLLLDDRALQLAIGRLQGSGMREALASRRDLLTLPSPAIADLVRHDPLGLYDLLRDRLGGLRSGVAAMGAAEGGYVTPDGRRRLVTALPVRPPYDAQFSRTLMSELDRMRAAASGDARHEADDEEDTLPPVRLDAAGGHRIAVETEATVRRESITNGAGSLVLILPLLFLVFRSLWLVAVGPMPSALALILVLGGLGAAGATLSAAATASAAMLFGLGIDGVVLLYVAHTLALRDASAGPAAEHLEGPATSMLVGMWTTAATFYGLAIVDFPSLRQLGMLIGHSMVLCGVLTLVLVPALLPRRPLRGGAPLTMPRLAGWISRRRRAIVVAAAALTVASGIAALGLRVNPTLERLRSVTEGSGILEAVARDFGLPSDVYVVVQRGPDLDALLERNEALALRVAQEIPTLTIQPASWILPSHQTQEARAARVRGAGLSPAAVSRRLAAAAREEGYREDTFAPFVARLPQLLAQEERLDYKGYVEHGLGEIVRRFVTKQGDEWLLASYFFPTRDQIAPLYALAENFDGQATLTGLPLVNVELAERFVPEFLKGLAAGSAVVVVMIGLVLRSWRLSALALAPVAMGLLWAAGALALLRIELDLFALFAAVTFVGIGVDYGLHLVHRYRERGNAHRAVEELAPVILVAAAITALGYGTLIASDYPPLRSIGTVSLVAVATLTAASVLVLPAILAKPR